jgi:hypothetical protein
VEIEKCYGVLLVQRLSNLRVEETQKGESTAMFCARVLSKILHAPGGSMIGVTTITFYE